MEDYIGRKEHAEFVKRMEEEHHRFNERIEKAEKIGEQIVELTYSIKEMNVNQKAMLEEQKAQRKDIEELKGRDGAKWRKAVEYVLMAILGAAVGYVTSQLF